MKRKQIAILLIEDNPGDARLIREILPEGKGAVHSLEWVDSLTAGQQRIARGGIDLVLLDLGLPESTGLETLRRLRAGAGQWPIVVVMSGLEDEDIAAQAVLEGAQDYLIKGQVDSDLLNRSIRYAIERNEAASALQRAHDELEDQVAKRTAALAETIESLQREVTERKRAEEEVQILNQELERRVAERTRQLEDTNKELEAFAYSVSHNLRSPLRHIDGFIELLQKRIGAGLDEQSRHYMTNIADSARQMGILIDDLLSFQHMGRNAMSMQQVDLGALVREVIRELAPDVAGRNIHWQISELPEVTGDRLMLRMALVNLISNALKFTKPCEEARIEIGSQPGTEAGHVIYVRDNGVGFDMAYVERLFNVFQRLHRTEEFEGTGIGLAIVKRIINRHGGKVWAEGSIGKGAAFYFDFHG